MEKEFVFVSFKSFVKDIVRAIILYQTDSFCAISF